MAERTRTDVGRSPSQALRWTIAVVVSAATTVPVIALAHDLTPIHPPVAISWALTLGVVGLATRLLGTPVARRLRRDTDPFRAVILLAAVAGGALPIAAPIIRLLSSPIDPVSQLAWTLGEEDNAQVIGLAREIIIDGPAGGVLADQYGTGAMVLATTLMRMIGVPDGSLDPRLLAIHAFSLSTLLAIGVLAVGIWLLVVAALGTTTTRVHGGVRDAISAMGVAAATAAALALVVVVPMRSGFLTFVWGMAWAVLAAALAAVTPERDRPTTILGAVGVLAAVLLLIRSWPFLGAAIVPPLVVAATRSPIRDLVVWLRRRPFLAVGLAAITVGGGIAYLARSALGEVLSYGLDALTIGGSGISIPDGVRTVLLVAVIAVALTARGIGWRWPTAVIGPTATAFASWVALEAAADLLTGGELNYGGAKLLYGVVALGIATVVPVSIARAGSVRGVLPAIGGTVVAGALALGGVGIVDEVRAWDARLEPSRPPHAVAMIEAIDRTTPDLPVRCRPEPGTTVTPTSRWAAYFCVRWVEDALNGPGRDDGKRMALLGAEGETFDRIVAEAEAEGLYGFAYVMPLGPGWFGWNGGD